MYVFFFFGFYVRGVKGLCLLYIKCLFKNVVNIWGNRVKRWKERERISFGDTKCLDLVMIEVGDIFENFGYIN